MPPVPLTSRSTSTHRLAARTPGDGPAGGGPAGRPPARRSLARSTSVSRDGTVLIRHPPMLRWQVAASIQNVTCCPARAGPSQNCCGPTVMLPLGGTTRSTSIASGQLAGSEAAVAPSGTGDGLASGSRSAGAHKLSASPASAGKGRNREAGVAMPRDWCGRSWLYSWRQASTAAWASSIVANGPAWSRKSVCRVWCQRSTLPMVVGE